MQKEDPPLVSLKVTNPITFVKIWWKKVIGNEGVSLSFKIKPLTAIFISIVVTLMLTGAGFSLGWLASIPLMEPIIKYVPEILPTPTASPWKDTAFTGSLKYSESTNKYFLVTTSSEAITLQVPANIDLSKFIGRRILASGNYNKSLRLLIVADAQDLEVLPTKAVIIPTLTPVPSIAVTIIPTPTYEIPPPIE
jgi:hypothetical protein